MKHNLQSDMVETRNRWRSGRVRGTNLSLEKMMSGWTDARAQGGSGGRQEVLLIGCSIEFGIWRWRWGMSPRKVSG